MTKSNYAGRSEGEGAQVASHYHGQMIELQLRHDFLVEDEEPGRFIKNFRGAVYVYISDTRKVKAGEFSIYVVDVESAYNERESVFQIFDSESALIGYYSLYEEDHAFKPEVMKAINDDSRWAPNILIFDRLEIYPKFRKQGLGLRVLRWLLMQFGMGCGLVAMKPYPLQFENGTPAENRSKDAFIKLNLGEFDANFKRAKKKLEAHYAKLGFQRVRGMEYMVADPLRVAPSVASLGADPDAPVRPMPVRDPARSGV